MLIHSFTKTATETPQPSFLRSLLARARRDVRREKAGQKGPCHPRSDPARCRGSGYGGPGLTPRVLETCKVLQYQRFLPGECFPCHSLWPQTLPCCCPGRPRLREAMKASLRLTAWYLVAWLSRGCADPRQPEGHQDVLPGG